MFRLKNWLTHDSCICCKSFQLNVSGAVLFISPTFVILLTVGYTLVSPQGPTLLMPILSFVFLILLSYPFAIFIILRASSFINIVVISLLEDILLCSLLTCAFGILGPIIFLHNSFFEYHQLLFLIFVLDQLILHLMLLVVYILKFKICTQIHLLKLLSITYFTYLLNSLAFIHFFFA